MDRPVRSTRGVRTTPITEEDKQKETQFYNQLFGDVNESHEDEQDSSVQIADVFHTMTKNEKANLNCMNYPYSRGCHYFYNLLMYPRLGNTSYVEDIHPHGTYNDQKCKEVFGSDLFNRKYIGLPKRQKSQDPRDKNVCHQYLFKNQDSKWRLDQQLYQLKYIQKHPKILEGGSSRNFYFLKRDVELSSLYSPETPIEEKQKLLRSKIQFLQHRRQKLYQQFFIEDELFYHSSLNQQFFNKKQQQEASFNVQNIIVQAICMSQINEEIFAEEAEEDNSKLEILFSIFTTLELSVTHPEYRAQCQQYNNVGRKQGLIPPSFIMSFINKEHLNWVGQVLAMRILQTQQDTAFLTLKTIWHKLFKDELIYVQQYNPIEKEEYIEAIRTAAANFKQKSHPSIRELPSLPKPSKSSSQFYFQQDEHTTQLSAKQYIILYCIYYLYERVGALNLDYRLIGNSLFRKYQYKLCQKIGPVVANVQLTIKKCFNVLMENIFETEVPIQIHYEYSPDNKTSMLWIVGKEGAEIISEEENEDEQQEGDDGQQGQQDQDDEEEDQEPNPQDKSDQQVDQYERPSKKLRLQ